MFVLPWDEKYLTGVEIIDKQHKEIVTTANMFHMRMEKRVDYEESLEMLKIFAYFTSVHFQVEESYMSISNFPDYRKHSAVHKQLDFELKKLMVQMTGDKESRKKATPNVVQFIDDWLINHIGVMDLKFAEHYRNYLEGEKQ